jgi:glucose-1-phosphate cytidylyltransferase
VKAVILAGGKGSRLAEATELRPKPMVEIGGRPIIWHIMKIYSHHGINDFIVCLGYRGYVIKEYFANYFLHSSNVTFHMRENRMEVHDNHAEPWRVTLVDTGEETMTGGRLKRVGTYLGNEPFCFTYGDGLGDIDIRATIAAHAASKKRALMTAVRPPGRFGSLELSGERITRMVEKPQGDGGWINGGFFVLSPQVLSYVAGDTTIWEDEPLARLAHEGQLVAHRHDGFWKPMDTLREQRQLEALWQSGHAPWKSWE